MVNEKGFKKKQYAWNPKNEFLYHLMASKPGVVCINWVFQGILGMDRSEKVSKVLIDLLLAVLFLLIFKVFLTAWLSILLAFVMAHTLNWLFNTHFWVMGRYIGITHNPPSKILQYIKAIAHIVEDNSFLLGVIVFGNMTRGGEVRPDSDVDIRYVRKKGFLNALRANIFSIREKIRALFEGFPLDSYICDDLSFLDKLRKDEKPIILFDPEDVLKRRYSQRGYDLLHNIKA